jgi:hypothetical protein
MARGSGPGGRRSLTKLPRRYIAWERLCLRGTTEYWVNAMDGQPFFLVTRPIDPGILTMLREEIVPRLERDAPGQPDSAVWKLIPFAAASPLSSTATASRPAARSPGNRLSGLAPRRSQM